MLFYPLFAFYFLTIKSKRRKKKRKGQRRSVRGSQGERNKDFTINFWDWRKFKLLISRRFSSYCIWRGLVAEWLHGRLSLRVYRKNFSSGDFFLAIFSLVTLPVRGWLHVPFSSRAGDATKFEKNRITCQAKNRSCSRGLTKYQLNVAFVHQMPLSCEENLKPWCIIIQKVGIFCYWTKRKYKKICCMVRRQLPPVLVPISSLTPDFVLEDHRST